MGDHAQEIAFTMIPDLYSIPYLPQAQPEQGEAKQKRRRRRKAKKDWEEGGELKKRKLSEEQVSMLEMSFGCEHKLESKRKDKLAAELGLDPRQVAVWFQNRRARWKNKTIEEEYARLKASHDNALLEKCGLETEILMLKDKLEEAQREITRLSERAEITSTNSPSSSLTIDAINHNPTMMQMGEYNFGGFNCASPFYMNGDSCLPSMEWTTYNI